MSFEDYFLFAATSAIDADVPDELLPLFISDNAALRAHWSSDMAGNWIDSSSHLSISLSVHSDTPSLSPISGRPLSNLHYRRKGFVRLEMGGGATFIFFDWNSHGQHQQQQQPRWICSDHTQPHCREQPHESDPYSFWPALPSASGADSIQHSRYAV